MENHREKKVVVLVTSAFGGVGGIESFNRTLIGALDRLASRRGWTILVLSLMDRKELPGAEQYLKSGRLNVRGFSGSRVQFSFWATRESRSADIVIIGHVNLAPLVLLMDNSLKYLIVHGVEVWKKLPRIKALGLRRIGNILSVSRFTQQEMIRQNGLRSEGFQIFPNTLDPLTAAHRSRADRVALGLPAGHMLLSVARLASSENYKNIRSVIECLPAVLAEVPDTFYVIVGEGSQRRAFEELAGKMGLTGKVFLPGAVSDKLLPSYYKSCDVFVLPSVKEGFGIVFLEAMHHGKPCIGARAGGIPEVVHDGVTGLLVDANQLAQELPKQILQLLRDPALCTRLGAQGKAELEKKFSFGSFCDRLETILCGSNQLFDGDPCLLET